MSCALALSLLLAGGAQEAPASPPHSRSSTSSGLARVRVEPSRKPRYSSLRVGARKAP